MAITTWGVKSPLITLSNNNLRATVTGSPADFTGVKGSAGFSTGKKYWECTIVSSTNQCMIGVADDYFSLVGYADYTSTHHKSYWQSSGALQPGGVAFGTPYVTGDIIGVALDADAKTVKFYKNNVLQGGGAVSCSALSGNIYPFAMLYNAGNAVDVNFGATAFLYTPPSGYAGIDVSAAFQRPQAIGGF